MKYLVLTLLIACSFFHVNSQHPDYKIHESVGEEEHEKKTGLKDMIRERSFPNSGSKNFGRYIGEMQSYRNQNPQQLVANWNYVDASGNPYEDVGRTHSITLDTINT